MQKCEVSCEYSKIPLDLKRGPIMQKRPAVEPHEEASWGASRRGQLGSLMKKPSGVPQEEASLRPVREPKEETS